MTINYKADDVAGPSIRGFDGTTTGDGALTKANIATSSSNIDLGSGYLGRWVTIVPNGTTVYFRLGKTSDTVTAVTTDVPLSSGEKFHFRVTKQTQRIGIIGAATVTNGFIYWGSESPSPYQA